MVVTVFYPQQNYLGNLLVYVCNILFSARATFQICLCLSQYYYCLNKLLCLSVALSLVIIIMNIVNRHTCEVRVQFQHL